MRHAVAVLCLMLSACAARKPPEPVPKLPVDIVFLQQVKEFGQKAGVRGHVFVAMARPEQLGGAYALTWRIEPGVYMVVANRLWLRQASSPSILDAAVHEVCHIALGHVDDLADGVTDQNAVNYHDSFWHRQVYRCVVELIGEDLFCKSMTDLDEDTDTAGCRAYLWKIHH